MSDSKTFGHDLLNAARDATGYVSMDPGAHKSPAHTLGVTMVVNLDHAKNKGTGPITRLSEKFASKYPGGQQAERMQIQLDSANFKQAIIGTIEWDKAPAALNLRPPPKDAERIELIQKFRALYAVDEALRMISEKKA